MVVQEPYEPFVRSVQLPLQRLWLLALEKPEFAGDRAH